ncbi:hypothetical protein M422DRAFT_251105 [Sphaerobolus stellatus SS14]|uniref:Restriction of telomere capping protein 4 n=1 Tax=Sphaerobolus stellatus (strain SS14) TaxID=990650 RepID=A0A0C9UR03_SPHS4|nr:hypothetical protein M422DRAFT_251105 [Sphaerobolus stellatus SS14]
MSGNPTPNGNPHLAYEFYYSIQCHLCGAAMQRIAVNVSGREENRGRLMQRCSNAPHCLFTQFLTTPYPDRTEAQHAADILNASAPRRNTSPFAERALLPANNQPASTQNHPPASPISSSNVKIPLSPVHPVMQFNPEAPPSSQPPLNPFPHPSALPDHVNHPSPPSFVFCSNSTGLPPPPQQPNPQSCLAPSNKSFCVGTKCLGCMVPAAAGCVHRMCYRCCDDQFALLVSKSQEPPVCPQHKNRPAQQWGLPTFPLPPGVSTLIPSQAFPLPPTISQVTPPSTQQRQVYPNSMDNAWSVSCINAHAQNMENLKTQSLAQKLKVQSGQQVHIVLYHMKATLPHKLIFTVPTFPQFTFQQAAPQLQLPADVILDLWQHTQDWFGIALDTPMQVVKNEVLLVKQCIHGTLPDSDCPGIEEEKHLPHRSSSSCLKAHQRESPSLSGSPPPRPRKKARSSSASSKANWKVKKWPVKWRYAEVEDGIHRTTAWQKQGKSAGQAWVDVFPGSSYASSSFNLNHNRIKNAPEELKHDFRSYGTTSRRGLWKRFISAIKNGCESEWDAEEDNYPSPPEDDDEEDSESGPEEQLSLSAGKDKGKKLIQTGNKGKERETGINMVEDSFMPSTESIQPQHTTCPFCATALKTPLPPRIYMLTNLLTSAESQAFGQEAFTKLQLELCELHGQGSQWNLPWIPQDIDFNTLTVRVTSLADQLQGIAMTPNSNILFLHYSLSLNKAATTLLPAFDPLTARESHAGYYGERGLQLILSVLKDLFLLEAQEHTHSSSSNIFTAIWLIQNDLNCTATEAYQYWTQSRKHGELFNTNMLDEETARHPIKAEANAEAEASVLTCMYNFGTETFVDGKGNSQERIVIDDN